MADVAYIPGEAGRERRPAIGYAMVISAALLFALNGTVSKVVLQSGISSLELTQVRATGAFLGFALVLALTRRESLRLTRREVPYLIVFGIAGVALVQWLYFVSIGRLPIGIALLIEYIAPILIALWAWSVFKEPIRRRIWVALVLAVRRPRRGGRGLERADAGRARRDCGALGRRRLRGLRADGRARRQVARPRLADRLRLPLRGALLGGGAADLALSDGRLDDSVSLLGHLERFSLPVWLLLLYVVVAGTMITFLLVAAALRHISATRVGIVAMLEPVAASAVAFLWLGESFGAAQLVGGAIVLTAILLAQTSR